MRLIRIADKFKLGDSDIELGEEIIAGVYYYFARRNGGAWEPLAQYGNRLPPEWLDEAERPGYHLAKIPSGTFGEASKITEEAAEFADAIAQGSKVMALVELSDLMGATQAYLDRHHSGTTIDDLCMMAAITNRAFNNGHRASR